MTLYHVSYEKIPVPDIRHGRKNADFGQGFYLSQNGEFAGRWAREKKEAAVFVNTYVLVEEGLHILRFERDKEWFDYIFNNRRAREDMHPEADVIIGPIANDTLYETFGMITSGYLTPGQALQLLQIGPCYEQVVIKSEKAASQLSFVSAEELPHEKIAAFQKARLEEEAEYQKLFAGTLENLTDNP